MPNLFLNSLRDTPMFQQREAEAKAKPPRSYTFSAPSMPQPPRDNKVLAEQILACFAGSTIPHSLLLFFLRARREDKAQPPVTCSWYPMVIYDTAGLSSYVVNEINTHLRGEMLRLSATGWVQMISGVTGEAGLMDAANLMGVATPGTVYEEVELLTVGASTAAEQGYILSTVIEEFWYLNSHALGHKMTKVCDLPTLPELKESFARYAKAIHDQMSKNT